MAVVVAAASALVALALLPTVAGLGNAFEEFDSRFLAERHADISFPRFPERSSIYASDGSLLATIYLVENRKYVRLWNMSEVAKQSVLAIEDARFYEHGGVDTQSILRALIANVRAGEITQGGSTITQQLVKLQFTESEPTFTRKLEEASTAFAVERTYTKDQILELYMNKVYLANGVYGFGTAAEYYFGKPAKELTLPEAALLAGMISAPEDYNPVTHPDAAMGRRNVVVERLAALGWITEAEAESAKASAIELKSTVGQLLPQKNPFFVQFITGQMLDLSNHQFDVLGTTVRERTETLFQGGLKIYTTLNPKWQQYAQQAVQQNLPTKADPDAAVVTVETRTGAIKTMLSGARFEKEKIDLVFRGRRQTGSAFKPFTLVAAFREGIPPGKVYETSTFTLPQPDGSTYVVENFGDAGGSGGFMDLWSATQYSVNPVFIRLIQDVGPENVVKAARDMGVTGSAYLPAVPSLTLGAASISPLDMASGFSTLANDGKHCDPYAVERVETRRGDELYHHQPKAGCERVISADIAHLVTAMLQRVVTGGTGTRAAIGRPQAGKTGSQQDNVDAWFVGYVPQLSTSVWVGHARGLVPMLDDFYGSPVYGGTFPAQIWHDYMIKVVKGLPVQDFPLPPPPEYGNVPSVVGLIQEEAEEILSEANFTPIAVEVRAAEPAGTVVAQSPGAGARVVLGVRVEISVSNGKGPPRVFVPNVLGLTKQAAIHRLEQRGLLAEVVPVPVTDPGLEGIVLDQSPLGGKADEGSTVTIGVGTLAPPEPPPTPTPTPTPTPGTEPGRGPPSVR
jgi:penicillin-binding protein 1A